MPKRETVISKNNTTVNALVQYWGTFVFNAILRYSKYLCDIELSFLNQKLYNALC